MLIRVARLRSIAQFQHGLAASMVVRAGQKGILQEVPLQVGQYAQAGFTLAKVLPRSAGVLVNWRSVYI